ncbi:MAG: single-stranded-DNA-specific exonuclease RecJ [Deltaproteobacteria bacterium GWC2_42_11]|nr:MAG: single-stranded-DNA-specific exonuclease RecJ [Deltaproteobacteria bacterium GWC2_42_11]HBO84009.1 single-stranded-DNA-specific exonuclease RecJ [Deltaproteobacteria bacterium]
MKNYKRIKNKRWFIQKPDEALQELFVRELGIYPLTAQLLINRGISDIESAFCFLSPELKNLHNPFLMKDMDKAVVRIIEALQKNENIVIYGDYDVDGTTATSILYLFLKEIGANVSYYIPERLKEGYGLNKPALEGLYKNGAKIIITTDCGISNYDEVLFANSLGWDVIITDHHEVPSRVPPAFAVLNPKQSDCNFPFKELAGVGVAFNLIMALRSRLRGNGYFANGEPNLKNYLDLVALGTIADMVPLVDENRIFARSGLELLSSAARPGIKALKDVSRVSNGSTTSGHVSFQLAPRINAAGRLEKADTSVKLMTADNPDEALRLARELDRENSARQNIESEILNEAVGIIEDYLKRNNLDNAIVLASEKWHQGVIGVVASRLVDMYYRPTILISISGEIGKGSGRGIRGFHILEGLQACSQYLEKFGGHKAAAGLNINKGNVLAFRDAFLKFASKLKEDDLIPRLSIDAPVHLDELNENVVREIDSLAPFGLGNTEPILCAKDVQIIQSQVVGTNHLRFKTTQKNRIFNAIAFGFGDMHPIDGKYMDMAFTPCVEEWNGNKDLKLNVKGLKEVGH